MECFLELPEYQEHKKICIDRKEVIASIYDEVMYYTTPMGKAATGKIGNEKPREVNATIYEASISFKNFVMYALFGAKIKWAKSDVLTPLLRKKFGTNDLDGAIKRYKEELNKVTDDVFEYIMTSNYEKEIGKALLDWGELGTGCWEIIEQNSDKTPFTNRYVAINELLFNEDVDGEASIVFRYQYEYKINDLKMKYPKANFTMINAKEDEKITVIECVMPHYENNNKTYEWILFNDDITMVLDRKEMKYNPYNIVRFSHLANTCWGIGLGIVCLDAYKRINYFENLRARQAARIVEPPIAVIGDKTLIDNFSFEPNEVNWLGDSQMGATANAFPINTTGSLLPLEKDIDRLSQMIQQVHFNNPFGSAENNTTRAVNEIQYRMQLLQQKFSDAVANLYTEVLIPAFSKPKIILEKRGIIKKIEEDKYFKPKFVNLLTQTVDMQKVEKIMQFAQINAGLFPSTAPFILDETQTINLIADSLEVPDKVIATKEDREQNKAQALQQMAVQQMQQQQEA